MESGEKKEKFIEWLSKTIADIFDMFIIKFHKKYKKIVKDPLYINEEFENWYFKSNNGRLSRCSRYGNHQKGSRRF